MPESTAPQFKGSKVLVVEDYALNQELIEAMLEFMGIEVEIAEDGAEALEKLAADDFDLILMDIMMADMDGYETTTKIRATEKGANVPIVAVTANALPEDREKGLKVGMNDYITKPINKSDIEEVMKKYLTSDT